MTLGEKILLERKAAGLSQRQLCGDRITRNMLSQIEHGTARPSMETLIYLAQRLGKPVGFFLEPEASDRSLMEQARTAENPAQALELLRSCSQTDDWEWKYRMALALTALARQAMGEDRAPYARQLLEEAMQYTLDLPELECRRLLALGALPGMAAEAVAALPEMDEELLLRAQVALEQRKPERAKALLEAAENRSEPRWQLLCGRALMARGQYSPAAQCLEQAKGAFSDICYPLLEECYRELGDYKQAYFYACRKIRK